MRIYLDMVGCRLNQSEIESYARQFISAGHDLVESAAEADLVVINTCTVTAAAASDSRAKIRQAQRAGAERIAITGCWATLQPEAARVMEGVTYVIPNQAKDNLVKEILPEYDLEPLARQPVPGARHRTRAFIKVQDGCDNHCTFCVTRLARGASRSRPIEDVLTDIQAAIRNPATRSTEGVAREIVLSGVHLGSWGQDFPVPMHLKDLIQAILQDTDVERLRLSSLEPWDLDEDFFRLWENPRLCRHLHLPLQSGSAETLKRMGRNTTPSAYSRLVANARRSVPGIAITTDIIVAFPGESESEFKESLAFIEEMAFASGHVFTYSPRPGTPAARMKNQVNPKVGKKRNALVREVLHQSASQYRRSFIGSTLSVLWESIKSVGPDGWQLSGLTDNYLRVNAFASQPLWNQISLVKLEKEENGELLGTIEEQM